MPLGALKLENKARERRREKKRKTEEKLRPIYRFQSSIHCSPALSSSLESLIRVLGY
jgi:hypothetical protein